MLKLSDESHVKIQQYAISDIKERNNRMNAIDCIKTRRSIRKFQDKAVDPALIEQIVEAASYAPTWKNTQTARYYAITDPELKSKIANECLMGYEHNASIINGAPVLIVMGTIHGRAGYEKDGSFTTSKEDRWEVFDAGVCCQTFCLAAHDAGLGTVIMGVYDEKDVADAVGLPEGQIASCLIALGYPDQDPSAPKRKEVSELLTFK